MRNVSADTYIYVNGDKGYTTNKILYNQSYSIIRTQQHYSESSAGSKVDSMWSKLSNVTSKLARSTAGSRDHTG